MSKKYVQIGGFLFLVAALWYFVGAEVAAFTAIAVAIWEFVRPSIKG
ncbi:hypothetical protein IID24_04795 [Patescibacteria group bacterium]|nr:hypothetical protein [Patescibacteria group bacterium]